MAQRMVPFMRSGTRWSCGPTTRIEQRRRFWSRVLRWFSGDPENPPVLLSFVAPCSGRERHGTEQGVFRLPGVEASLLDDGRGT